MSILKRVKRSNTAPTEEKDSLGGRTIFETNVYPVEIKNAFVFVNKNGSTGCRIDAKMEDGRDYTTTLWIADKKGNNYYVKDNKQYLLPAYIMLNTMLQLVADKTLDEMDDLEIENKVVKIGDENQSVDVLVDLIGANVLLAIEKQRKNKTEKNEEGKYVPINEVQYDNELVKVYCAGQDWYGFTLNEILAEAEEATFMQQWLTKNQGKEIDKFKPVAESKAPAAKTGLARSAPARSITPRNSAPAADEPEQEEAEEEQDEQEAPAPVRRSTFSRNKG